MFLFIDLHFCTHEDRLAEDRRAKAEVEKAKRDLEARSFTLELDHQIPEGHDIFVVQDLGQQGGKYRYKVAFLDRKDNR